MSYIHKQALMAEALVHIIPPQVARAAQLLGSHNRVVTTGVGKSGIAAKKFAATLCAFGVSATFIHPVEALHGDMGMLQSDDAIVAFSASGNTAEVVEFLKQAHGAEVGVYGVEGIASEHTLYSIITGYGSDDDAISSHVPTISFLAQTIAADALAIQLAKIVSAPGPKATHPGGNLGDTQPWGRQ